MVRTWGIVSRPSRHFAGSARHQNCCSNQERVEAGYGSKQKSGIVFTRWLPISDTRIDRIGIGLFQFDSCNGDLLPHGSLLRPAVCSVRVGRVQLTPMARRHGGSGMIGTEASRANPIQHHTTASYNLRTKCILGVLLIRGQATKNLNDVGFFNCGR